MDKAQIENIAYLSRLELTESEKELFLHQLLHVFDYMDRLNELDTTDVVPMVNGIALENVFRGDFNNVSIATSQALENAPAKSRDFFKVPQVID